MTNRPNAMLASLAVVCLVALAAVSTSIGSGKTATVWPASEIKWSQNPAVLGAKFAVLWGNPDKGAHGALRTVPADSLLALHTHTNDQKVIVLSGTIALVFEDQGPKIIGPGSYAFIPGGLKHSAVCQAGAECKYLEVYEGRGDIKFVEEKKK